MFSNSLRMIKTYQNTSELWQIVCKKHNFNISVFVLVLLCELLVNARTWLILKMAELNFVESPPSLSLSSPPLSLST